MISTVIEMCHLTGVRYFSIPDMKKQNAVAILAALAQDNRLNIFRLLVEAGPEGMPAEHLANSLKLAPNALTFHLDRLREADLVTVRREARSMIYAARFAAMNAPGVLSHRSLLPGPHRALRADGGQTDAVRGEGALMPLDCAP